MAWCAALLSIVASVLVLTLIVLYKVHTKARYWKNQAKLDPLTGLLNRRAFEQEVELVLSNNKTIAGFQCCLLFLDLDDFKEVNDEYGHAKEDEVLINIAELCTQNLRRQDLICRFGGEEFVVLLPNTELWQAWQIAERLRKAIKDSFSTISITISIGMSAFNVRTHSFKTILSETDQALYEAKRCGKNRIVLAKSCR
ncbi:hypothetical protein ACOMHN_013097 [Nucella lapillus]